MMLCDTYAERREKVKQFGIKRNSGFLGFFQSKDPQKKEASTFLNHLISFERGKQHPILCQLCQQCELGKKALASSLEKLNTLKASTENPRDLSGIDVKMGHISQALGATPYAKEELAQTGGGAAKP